jgi:hypothetical protein
VGLTMAERKAVTKQMARRYGRASKTEKGAMLDELCALTGWTRRHARRGLLEVLTGGGADPRQRPAGPGSTELRSSLPFGGSGPPWTVRRGSVSPRSSPRWWGAVCVG